MVAGCEVTVREHRHVVQIALRDGSSIVDVVVLSAPKSESESDSLAGLRVRACDVFRDRDVTQVAIWRYEGSHLGVKINTARPIMRAEGVLLAAAGEVGVPVREVSASSERGKGKNEELVTARVSGLGGSWTQDARRAVAASTFT
jgi:hypothetical protein